MTITHTHFNEKINPITATVTTSEQPTLYMHDNVDCKIPPMHSMDALILSCSDVTYDIH